MIVQAEETPAQRQLRQEAARKKLYRRFGRKVAEAMLEELRRQDQGDEAHR